MRSYGSVWGAVSNGRPYRVKWRTCGQATSDGRTTNTAVFDCIMFRVSILTRERPLLR